MKKYLLLLAQLMVLALSACGDDKAKDCSDLTKKGQDACKKPNAIEGKTCLWQNDACAEKPKGEKEPEQPTTVTACGDITPKDKTNCEEANKIAGKTCLWMVDECSEKTTEIAEFMKADQSFATSLTAGTDAFGVDHGETPNWELICTGAAGAGQILNAAVDSLAFNFKQDKNEVELEINCKGAAGKKTFDLLYKATPVTGALKLKFDLNGKEVIGKNLMQAADSNMLEFFSKPSWFYEAAGSIKGASLLSDIGYTAYDTMKMDALKDIDDAIAYAKGAGGGYNVGKVGVKDVGAITLILNKK